MAQTELSDVADQVQEFWSPLFMDELRESNPMLALLNKDYQGAIKKGGDTVYVSQIIKPAGETLVIGAAGDDVFTPTALSTSRVAIKADRRFVASYEFEDLVDLQSQIGDQNSAIRKALVDSMNTEINNHLYSLVAPVVGQVKTAVTTLAATNLSEYRRIAGKQKWLKTSGWYGLLSPDYYGDLMDGTTLTSTDFIPDQPMVGGEIVTRRYGFNIIEDNSDGLGTVAPIGDKAGVFFHPDFMHFVSQMAPRVKISDSHSNSKFGFKISLDMIGGAALGLQGDIKHISVIDT